MDHSARVSIEVMEKAACRSCHNPDGVASATRLQFPDAGAAPDKVEAFGRSLVILIDRDHPADSLLLKKPTNRIAHGGGERIKPGSPDEATLTNWIAKLTQLSGVELAQALKYREQEASAAARPLSRPDLRRLTHSQFNNTVRDLLGDETSPASQFPPEDFVNGFRNQSQAQSLSPLLIEAYSAAAEKLASAAFKGGDTHSLIPCKPSAACRARFSPRIRPESVSPPARSGGAKALRKPAQP